MNIFAAIALSAGAVLAIAAAYRLWPRDLDRTEELALERFMAAAQADGLSASDALSELRIREAFVRIRRIASDRVVRHPDRPEVIIQEVATAEAKRLASIYPGEAKRLVKWVENSPIEEILQPDAFHAQFEAMRRRPIVTSTRPEQEIRDRISAMGGW